MSDYPYKLQPSDCLPIGSTFDLELGYGGSFFQYPSYRLYNHLVIPLSRFQVGKARESMWYPRKDVHIHRHAVSDELSRDHERVALVQGGCKILPIALQLLSVKKPLVA